MKKAQEKKLYVVLVIAAIVAVFVAMIYYFRRKSTPKKNAIPQNTLTLDKAKEPKQPFSAEITQYFDSFLNANSTAFGDQLMVYVSQSNKEYAFKKGNGSFDDYSGIASLGKYLAAATIMTLVDEGKINLDTPMSSYLPWLQGKNLYETYTVRDVLAHHTCIVADSAEFDNRQGVDLDVATRGVVNANPFQAGMAYPIQYSSTSYKLAARVAEAVSGKKWEVLFNERIASKCEMTNTHFERFSDNPDVGKGAQSSPNDYAHFMEMLRNDGDFYGTRVLSADSVREMEKLQLGSLEYGLGCWVFADVSEVAAQGATGSRAWINRTNKTYAVLFTQQNNTSTLSTRFKELVRAKLS